MNNEVEVISRTCQAAVHEFAAATGNSGIPPWNQLSEGEKNNLRNRVTTELQRLRTGGGSPTSGPWGPDNTTGEQQAAITNTLFHAIVQGFMEADARLSQAA